MFDLLLEEAIPVPLAGPEKQQIPTGMAYLLAGWNNYPVTLDEMGPNIASGN
jgi:hypothetical protein